MKAQPVPLTTDRLLALLEQALREWAAYATSSRERADIAKIRADAGLPAVTR